jgi:hypothetical protein
MDEPEPLANTSFASFIQAATAFHHPKRTPPNVPCHDRINRDFRTGLMHSLKSLTPRVRQRGAYDLCTCHGSQWQTVGLSRPFQSVSHRSLPNLLAIAMAPSEIPRRCLSEQRGLPAPQQLRPFAAGQNPRLIPLRQLCDGALKPRDRLVEIPQLHHERRQRLAHFKRDCLVAGLDPLGQFAGVSGPLRCDDADPRLSGRAAR